jgi:hypothetical protein
MFLILKYPYNYKNPRSIFVIFKLSDSMILVSFFKISDRMEQTLQLSNNFTQKTY